MKKRIGWIDSFRAIMILFIVFGHAASEGALRQYVYSFHVASFFFISGFLFRIKPNETFAQFFRKKSYNLLVPYYIFSILSILVFAILGQFASQHLDVAIKTSDIGANIWGMLYANGATGLMKWNLPLWFIPCLFLTLIVMYPIAVLHSKVKAPKKSMTIYVGVMLLVFVGSFSNYYFFGVGELPFGFENTLYLLPFFMAGYGFRMISNLVNTLFKTKHYLIVGCLTIIPGFVLGTFFHTSIDYVSTTYGNLLMFYLSAFLSIIGYVCIFNAISIPSLYCVGRNTMPILLMHKFPVVLLQIILGRFINNSVLGVCIACSITIIACFLSLAVGVAIRRVVPFALGDSSSKS